MNKNYWVNFIYNDNKEMEYSDPDTLNNAEKLYNELKNNVKISFVELISYTGSIKHINNR